ncbi:MAG: hypothetical protein HGA90_06955 [Alphaproteobacteria bacterium]|nr:hypothetical protein [Alphaproteobacteria bacterium]
MSIHHNPPFVTTFMYFLPTFFEFFGNKRLFVYKRALPALAGVFSRHKLWYTVFIFAPDMVHLVIFRRQNPHEKRFSSFFAGVLRVSRR